VSAAATIPTRGRTDLASALGLSCRIAHAAWVARRPFLLYYKPTARCDCRCRICDRWERPGNRAEELSLPEVEDTLARFRRAGAVVLTMWGGEPLLRDDLPAILAAAKRLGYRTSLCTNASRLGERAAAVAPLLDVLLCSLDGLGERHDELRGVRGLFDRAVRGIEAARRHGRADVKIWTVVHRRNRCEIEPLARLARDLSVGIELFPLARIAGHNDELVLSAAERDAAFAEAQALKRRGLPIRNPDRALALMRTGAPFRCNFPTIAVSFDHRGTVHCCEDPQGTPLHEWGDRRGLDLDELYRSVAYRRVTRQLRSCNRCLLPCVAELAGSLPRALAGMLRSRTA
jgi:MoaA/NifB/PqqE/SkfB family radical SAM enzyme